MVGKKKSSRAEQTRRRLLDASLALVAEGGFQAMSNRAVAERSGVNLALISYHFGDQAGLKAAVVEAAVSQLQFGVQTRGGVLALLRGQVLRVPRAAQSQHVRVLLAALLAAVFDEEMAGLVRPQLDALRQSLTQVSRASGNNPRHARGEALLGAALLDGLMLHQLLNPNTDLRPAVEALRTGLRDGSEE